MKSPADQASQPRIAAAALPVWRRPLFQALAIVALVLLAFSPGFAGVYTWDDYVCIVDNPTLRSPAGLGAIWTDVTSNQDYYPLIFTSYWAEYRLWGVDPLGYHIVNALLHAGGAVALFFVLRRLGLKAAWPIAALWAVHPMQVESVTWVVERKNVLSGVCFFSSILAYLCFAGIGGVVARPWRWWLIALVCFVAAVLSKPLTCTLPAVLLLVLYWKLERPRWRDLWPALVFFIPAIGIALVQIWVQRHHVGAVGPDFAFTPVERLLIAGRSAWFYVGKALLPYPLMQVYPRFAIDAQAWWQYLFPLGTAGVLGALWLLRRKISRGPLAAALCFLALLAPSLGFISYYTMLYTFVADHHQYLALACVLTVLVTAAGRVWSGVGAPVRVGAVALALAVCVSLTWFFAGLYRSEWGLWYFNAQHNPSSFIVQINLGDALLKEYNRAVDGDPALAGEMLRAVTARYEEGIRLKPDDDRGYARLARMAYERNDDVAFRAIFTRMEQNVPIRGGRQNPLFSGDKVRAAGGDMNFFLARIYERKKDYANATACYRLNLRDFPRNAQALLGLAQIAAAQGQEDEALRLLEQARQIDPELLNRLQGPR